MRVGQLSDKPSVSRLQTAEQIGGYQHTEDRTCSHETNESMRTQKKVFTEGIPRQPSFSE